jgi:acyl-CoA thioesterase-1
MKNKVVVVIIFCLFYVLTPSAHAKNIVIFGDSLSAAYGMDLEKGWAHLLNESLKDKHHVYNASISGETTKGGLARMPLTLAELKPDLLLLEIGANDGLQGLPVSNMHSNLEKMIQLNQAAGVTVALIGISLPASYGPRYIDQFRSTYSKLATQYKLPFIDFYREEFVTQEGNIQADGLHPTEKTQPTIRDWVLEFLSNENLLN